MLKKGHGADLEKKTQSIETKKIKCENCDKITQEKLLIFVVSTHVIIHRQMEHMNFIILHQNMF